MRYLQTIFLIFADNLHIFAEKLGKLREYFPPLGFLRKFFYESRKNISAFLGFWKTGIQKYQRLLNQGLLSPVGKTGTPCTPTMAGGSSMTRTSPWWVPSSPMIISSSSRPRQLKRRFLPCKNLSSTRRFVFKQKF